MAFSPMCSKLECDKISNIVLYVKSFGPVYFCASHALWNLKTEGEIIQWNNV